MSSTVLPRLLKTGAHSDLTCTFRSDSFKVHKNIVCSQSSFFARAVKENAFKEGYTNTIELTDWDLGVQDARSIKLLIHFFYHQDYLVKECEDLMQARNTRDRDFNRDYDSEQGLLLDHVKMHALGVIYDVPALKLLAVRKFKQCSTRTAAGLAKAIRIAYSSTVEDETEMRDAVASVLTKDVRFFFEKPTIFESIKEFGGLSFRLLCNRMGFA